MMDTKEAQKLHSILLDIGENLMELGTDEVMKLPAYQKAMDQLDAAVRIVYNYLIKQPPKYHAVKVAADIPGGTSAEKEE